MQEIKCPKCGEVFQVDESGYAAIVKQVRDDEFKKEIEQREKSFASEKSMAVNLAVADVKNQKDSEIAQLRARLQNSDAQKQSALREADAQRQLALSQKDAEIERLRSQLRQSEVSAKLAVQNAVQDRDAQIMEL